MCTNWDCASWCECFDPRLTYGCHDDGSDQCDCKEIFHERVSDATEAFEHNTGAVLASDTLLDVRAALSLEQDKSSRIPTVSAIEQAFTSFPLRQATWDSRFTSAQKQFEPALTSAERAGGRTEALNGKTLWEVLLDATCPLPSKEDIVEAFERFRADN